MRAVIQRVSEASVVVAGEVVGEIDAGLLALVAVVPEDGRAESEALAAKLVGLRVFPDEVGKMNRSVADAGGAVLLVSQFTLLADTSKGRRPSFVGAAPPEVAEPEVERLAAMIRDRGVPCETGTFGAHMEVRLVNDGPVTLVLDVSDGEGALTTDRWLIDDAVNALAPRNVERVVAALEPPNVVFGLHRWYRMGSGPDAVSFATDADFEAELARCRPGDMLMLFSLDDVTDLAALHIGDMRSAAAPVPDDVEMARLADLQRVRSTELFVVNRFAPAHVEDHGACFHWAWDDDAAPVFADPEWSRLRGESWLFHSDVVPWLEGVPRGGGSFLLDGIYPDAEGRVVIGGPY